MTTHYFPATAIQFPDGSALVKPGKPVTSQEVGTNEFARATGISQRRAQQLCDEGRIKFRRLTDSHTSKILIPVEEIARFKTSPL